MTDAVDKYNKTAADTTATDVVAFNPTKHETNTNQSSVATFLLPFRVSLAAVTHQASTRRPKKTTTPHDAS